MQAALLFVLPATALGSSSCDAHTFPQDLGSTHCPRFARHAAANEDECVAACCAQGDGCETWQWCEAGKACASGFWPQPGALSAGHDLDGWPKNTTIAVAERACAASTACIGLTYHSKLDPGNATLKMYLKSSGAGPAGDSSWSRYMKATPGCFTGKRDASCAKASDSWLARARAPRPTGPCDILAAAGSPCVAAHSVVRRLYQNYAGPLYRVLRDADKAALNIGAHYNGFADVEAQEAFCARTSCYVVRICDQHMHMHIPHET